MVWLRSRCIYHSQGNQGAPHLEDHDRTRISGSRKAITDAVLMRRRVSCTVPCGAGRQVCLPFNLRPSREIGTSGCEWMRGTGWCNHVHCAPRATQSMGIQINLYYYRCNQTIPEFRVHRTWKMSGTVAGPYSAQKAPSK